MVWFSLLIFLLGLSIGSFLNVLIHRLPHDFPLTGRSFCPKCRKKIAWFDNLPLISFFLLRGKCRFCHSPISIQYPLVELVTGILFLATFFSLLNQSEFWLIEVIGYWIILSSLVAIFFIDLKHQIIPDKLVFPAIFVSFLLLLFSPSFFSSLFSAIASSGFFLLLYFLTGKKGMGFGDVKLAFLMGLFLGYPKIIVALYLAFLTGAGVGVILILTGKKGLKGKVPFGPFLVLGTILSLFWGEKIFQWFIPLF